MTRLRDLVARAAVGTVAGHLVLTAVDNLPDQHATARRIAPWAGEMPTWRFFGPNPGVDDIHLFTRPAVDGSPTAEWEEVDLSVDRPWWAPLWNPGTRGPKALFDATQQLKMLAVSHDGDFDAIASSPPYRLLADHVIRAASRFGEPEQVQFLLLTSRPGPSTSELQPVLVSRFLDCPGASRTPSVAPIPT